jgi:hypothetical protein
MASACQNKKKMSSEQGAAYVGAWVDLFNMSRRRIQLDSVIAPPQFQDSVDVLVATHSLFDGDETRVATFRGAVIGLFVELQFQHASLARMYKFTTRGEPSPLEEDPRIVGLLSSNIAKLDFSRPEPGIETRINHVNLRIQRVLACMPRSAKLAVPLEHLYRSHLREQAMRLEYGRMRAIRAKKLRRLRTPRTNELPPRFRKLDQTTRRIVTFARAAWGELSRL